MTLNDPLANVLSHINNSEKKGKSECIVCPASKMILNVLKILEKNNYIGKFEIIDKRRGGYIKINLIGQVNKCGVIKPRFSFTLKESEKYEKRYLPARTFGVIIVTTSKGLMLLSESIEKNLGGKLLAYCY